MSTLTLTLSLCYLGLLLLFSVWPMLKANALEQAADANLSETDLIDNREQLLQMLRDLKLDFELNKISKEQFEQQNNSLRAELTQVLQKIQVI